MGGQAGAGRRRSSRSGGLQAALAAHHGPCHVPQAPLRAANKRCSGKLPASPCCLPQPLAPSLIIGIYYRAHLLPLQGQKVKRSHRRCHHQGSWEQMAPDKCTFKRILWPEHSEHQSQADKENKVQNTKKMSAFNPLIRVMEPSCQSPIPAAVSKKNELLCPEKM